VPGSRVETGALGGGQPLEMLHDFGGLDGNPFIVKNLFELKNAQRVLFEGNVAEYTWGGFTQAGYALMLTPKNQAGTDGSNLCPACVVGVPCLARHERREARE